MRDAFVHRELEHLRVDHDEPYLVGRRLVENAQDHRVQGHRLARAGGSGDEKMRHAREVHDDRLSRNVLSETESDRRCAPIVARGAQDLAQVDQLHLFVGDFEADDGFPGNDLDDSDADRRERAGEVLREGGDPTHLQARGRLELEAGDDRSGMNGDHLDVDSKVTQLDLHLTGHRLEGGRRHGGRPGGRLVEPGELRKSGALPLEENRLPLPIRSRARLYLAQHWLDAGWSGASGVPSRLRRHLLHPLPACMRDLAAFSPAPRQPRHGGKEGQGEASGRLHHGQPRHPGEQRPTREKQAQHDHGGAEKVEGDEERVADDGPQDPPRPDSVRKRSRIAVVQGGDPARGHEHHRESDAAGHPDKSGRWSFPIEKHDDPDRHEQERKDPCHMAEQLEEKVGDPRADEPPSIDHVFRAVADRPARIAAVIARDREGEKDRGRRKPDEGCFAPPSAERLGEQP